MDNADKALPDLAPGHAPGGEESEAGLAVQFVCDHPARLALSFDRATLQELLWRMVQATFAAEDAPFVHMELLVVDEAYMENLNRESMSCSGPTNVLSFPATASVLRSGARCLVAGLPLAAGLACATSPLFLGSLVLASHTMRREAFLYGQEVEAYCIRLLAHGFAHLLELDHGPEMDAVAEGLERAATNSANALAGGFTPAMTSGNEK